MNFFQLPVPITSNVFRMLNLEVVYPFVTASPNFLATQRMNRQISALINRLITEQGYYQNPETTQVTGTFEIKNNQRGVLSLSITNYTYPYHAAHGNTIIKSLTFDIHTGRNYQLHELFKPDSDYQNVLAKIIEQQIKERDIPILGQFPGVKSNQDYYIADKALVVYYQLYEFTPYVFGFPQFPISVYEIQDIIKENSPLGVMLANN